MLTDLEAAFPLVARRWMLYAFSLGGADTGSMNFLTAVHQDTWAVRWNGALLSFEYLMWSGILQGCPLAGFCFIVLFAPTLWMLSESLSAADRVFVCADDVMVTLGAINRSATVDQAFALSRAASCLRLNLRKCFLVPLFSRCSAFAQELLRDAVCRVCHSWASVSIVGCATFLGTPFGPDATIETWWQEPLAKFNFRCSQIRATQACPTLAGSLMSARAVSCLSYVAQFQLPPKALGKLEAWKAAQIFHAPGGTFSRSLAAHLLAIAKVKFSLPTALCWATFPELLSRPSVVFALAHRICQSLLRCSSRSRSFKPDRYRLLFGEHLALLLDSRAFLSPAFLRKT